MIKNKITKIICASTATCLIAVNNTLAIDNSVKIGGLYDSQAIYYKNNGKAEQRVVSNRNKNFGFYTSGHLFVDYKLIAENDNLYGAKISLEHTTVNDRSVPFYLYFESGFGRVEAGAESSAGKKMRINGYSASCGPGNGWNSTIKPSPNTPNSTSKKLTAYITNFCSFLDAKTRTSVKSDYSRKITYFTPKISLSDNHRIQVGLSYVPDSSNMGHEKIDIDKQNQPVVSTKYTFVIKDAISYGVVYNGKIFDQLETKIAFVGEHGKTHAFNKGDKKRADIKFKDLNTYVVGGMLTYEKISVSASYGNYNKSLTAKEVDLISRDSSVYGFGAKYTIGKYAFSINQFNSSHKKSKLSATSFAVDYNIVQGLKTYLQSTFYQTNGKYLENNVIKSDKNKGTLIFLGAKISF